MPLPAPAARSGTTGGACSIGTPIASRTSSIESPGAARATLERTSNSVPVAACHASPRCRNWSCSSGTGAPGAQGLPPRAPEAAPRGGGVVTRQRIDRLARQLSMSSRYCAGLRPARRRAHRAQCRVDSGPEPELPLARRILQQGQAHDARTDGLQLSHVLRPVQAAARHGDLMDRTCPPPCRSRRRRGSASWRSCRSGYSGTA